MKNRFIYIILFTFIALASCEDKMKDEYNQIQEDLEKLKEEQSKSETEKNNLTAEQIELAKQNQIVRLDKYLNWYLNFFVNKGALNHRMDDFTTKNIFADGVLKSTQINYTSYDEIRNYDANYFSQIKETITHTLDDNGLIAKSEAIDYTLTWTWNDDNSVKVYMHNKVDNSDYEFTSNADLLITNVKQLKNNGELLGGSIYNYNQNGLLTHTESTWRGNKSDIEDYTYDENNNMIKYTYKYREDSEPNIYNLSYDNKNRLIKIYTKKDKEHEQEIENTFSYDNGYIIKSNNKTTGKLLEKKYTDSSMKIRVYNKMTKTRYKVDELYENNYLISRTIKSTESDGEYKLYLDVYTREDDVMQKAVSTTTKYSPDNKIISKTRKTYYDLVYRDGKNLYEYPHVNYYSDYKYKYEELNDEGEMEITRHYREQWEKIDGEWVQVTVDYLI
jgi:hypothetical protein